MFPRTTPRRWPIIFLAALAASLALAAAALADGEDDPTFASPTGTAYPFTFQQEDGQVPQGAPQSSVAPNGKVIHAGAVRPLGGEGPGPERGDGPGFGIRVSQVHPGGQNDASFGIGGSEVVSTDDGGPQTLLDVRAMGDNTIMLAVGAFEPPPVPSRGSTFAADHIALIHLDQQGQVLDEDTFPKPEGCDTAPTAEIAADGSAFALWKTCRDDKRGAPPGLDLLVHIGTGSADWVETIPDIAALDVALGPDGRPYVVGIHFPDADRDIDSYVDSAVLRWSTDGTLDGTYGGLASSLDGAAVDFDVDGSGRAVVWVSDYELNRDADGPWHFRRLTPSGAVDTGYGGDGLAALDGPEFSETFTPLEGCDQLIVFDDCHLWNVKAQPDGKVIATGPEEPPEIGPGRGVAFDNRWTVARLGADGERDLSWDHDGVRMLEFDDVTNGDFSVFFAVNQASLQPDGKVILPELVANISAAESRIIQPDGLAYGLQRLNVTPPPQPPAATPPAPPAPVAGAAPSLQAPKTCKSRRTFTIRLRTGRKKGQKSPIVSATVLVNGKKVTVSRAARRTAKVNLTTLPKGRFTVSIRLKLKDGGTVRETRRYRTCTPKIESELGPLRTSPPKKGRR